VTDFEAVSRRFFAGEKNPDLELYYRYLPAGPERHTARPWIGAPVVERNILSTFPFRAMKLHVFAGESPAEILSLLDHPKACGDRAGAPLAACILARPEDLEREIAVARTGIPRAAETGIEWKTPGGSSFVPQPLGADGVAFIYPGIASPYPGLGADLFTLSPPFLDRFETLARGNAAHYLHVDEMYPVAPVDEAPFYRDVVMLGQCAISTSLIFTWLLREMFGIQPKAACGYSFGEAIMLTSLGVWPDPTELAGNLDRIPTYRTRLQGPMDAIREQWGLAPGEPVGWDSWTVRTTAAVAFAAIKPEKNVFLCNINTLGEVVIAGEREGCKRALERIGASVASPVPIPVTMHCEATRGEYRNLVDIHTLTTASVPEIEFFTSSTCKPIDFAKESPAQTTAEGYCKVVDFPRLVRNVYASGPKIFIEAGGRRNCCTWIEKILRDRPHAAIPCDLKGQGSDTAMLRALARLVSQRVPVNLRALTETA
jgi:PfaB family protein